MEFQVQSNRSCCSVCTIVVHIVYSIPFQFDNLSQFFLALLKTLSVSALDTGNERTHLAKDVRWGNWGRVFILPISLQYERNCTPTEDEASPLTSELGRLYVGANMYTFPLPEHQLTLVTLLLQSVELADKSDPTNGTSTVREENCNIIKLMYWWMGTYGFALAT